MKVQQTIQAKITRALDPVHLEVVNESHMHNVPPGSESHFKVVVVSERFVGRRLIQRHRAVNEALAEELRNDVHALALHTMTPDEWSDKAGKSRQSPLCMGKSKG